MKHKDVYKEGEQVLLSMTSEIFPCFSGILCLHLLSQCMTGVCLTHEHSPLTSSGFIPKSLKKQQQKRTNILL